MIKRILLLLCLGVMAVDTSGLALAAEYSNITALEHDLRELSSVETVETVDGTLYSNGLENSVTLPFGTEVTVVFEDKLVADRVKEQELITLRVKDSVYADGVEVIKPGTLVRAIVVHKQNNFICGVPGEIEIDHFRVMGRDIGLAGKLRVKGRQRYWVNLGWGSFPPAVLVKGNDANIHAGTTATLKTAETVYFDSPEQL